MRWNKIREDLRIRRGGAACGAIYELVEEPETGVSGREAFQVPLPSGDLPRTVWLGDEGRWIAED